MCPSLPLLPVSRRARSSSYFEPVGRAAGTVGRVLALRHNAFEPHLAGMAKHCLAIALHVLIEPNARAALGEDHFQCCLAAIQRRAGLW